MRYTSYLFGSVLYSRIPAPIRIDSKQGVHQQVDFALKAKAFDVACSGNKISTTRVLTTSLIGFLSWALKEIPALPLRSKVLFRELDNGNSSLTLDQAREPARGGVEQNQSAAHR
ncbi:hypothetical protein B296_00000048 [Ensete ventricosum]|uniref:Uncharacterized protein n=1 Tax=Ensete ventricosum TaxID=4639 RepID=A0A426ZTH7_ENSVE|nr:hypothetical protein B296_00000048 [Ensete ventricosum]